MHGNSARSTPRVSQAYLSQADMPSDMATRKTLVPGMQQDDGERTGRQRRNPQADQEKTRTQKRRQHCTCEANSSWCRTMQLGGCNKKQVRLWGMYREASSTGCQTPQRSKLQQKARPNEATECTAAAGRSDCRAPACHAAAYSTTRSS